MGQPSQGHTGKVDVAHDLPVDYLTLDQGIHAELVVQEIEYPARAEHVDEFRGDGVAGLLDGFVDCDGPFVIALEIQRPGDGVAGRFVFNRNRAVVDYGRPGDDIVFKCLQISGDWFDG